MILSSSNDLAPVMCQQLKVIFQIMSSLLSWLVFIVANVHNCRIDLYLIYAELRIKTCKHVFTSISYIYISIKS